LLGAQPAGVWHGAETSAEEVPTDDVYGVAIREQEAGLCNEVGMPLPPPLGATVCGHEPRTPPHEAERTL
jgi:hypothetical protein